MNVISRIIGKLQETVNVEADYAGAIAGTEDVAASVMPVVESKRHELDASIEAALESLAIDKDSPIELEPHQIEIAKSVAKYALDPIGYLNQVSKNGRGEVEVAGESKTIDTAMFREDVYSDNDIAAAIEAFDSEKIGPSLFFSIVFNTLSIKQDPVAELFYPIVPIEPTQNGGTVKATIVNIMETVKRDISGKPTEIKKTSIVKELNNTELFTLDSNRIYPNKKNDEEDKYTLRGPGVEREVEVQDGVKITTAPLKTNVEASILGISQTKELIANGLMDETDALSSHLAIDGLYFNIHGKDKDGNEIDETHKREIHGLPATFTYTPTGHNKDLQLDYKTDSFAWIGAKILKADGTKTNIKDLQDLPAGYTVKLRVNLKGDANAQSGNVVVYPVKMEMAGLKDASGNDVPETSDLYVKMKKIFDDVKSKVIGWDPDSYVTNSNARFRGKLLTTDTYTTIYTVPVRTKIREITPIFKNGDDSDQAGLIGQINWNRRALSKAGLMELNKTAVVLANLSEDTEAYGISNKLVKKTLITDTLDLTKIVDSLKSSERVDDIVSAIKLTIRNNATELYIRSNYNFAHEADATVSGTKPTVIVGVDTNIGRFLGDFSDELFNYKVSVSPDSLVHGKVFISFGVMGARRNKETHPLNFGVCFWSPEAMISLQRQEKGTIKQETMSMARYVHQTIMPILAVLEVTGVDEVSGKQPIMMVNG